MIKLIKVTTKRRIGLLEFDRLSRIDLDVASGESVAILGSAVDDLIELHSVIGLLNECSSGDYLIDGSSTRGLSESKISELRNEKIGFVGSLVPLIPDRTVLENIKLPLEYRRLGSGDIRRFADECLARFELSNYRDSLASDLSEAQRLQVSIARAAIANPSILLLDSFYGSDGSRSDFDLSPLAESLAGSDCALLVFTTNAGLAAKQSRIHYLAEGKLS